MTFKHIVASAAALLLGCSTQALGAGDLLVSPISQTVALADGSAVHIWDVDASLSGESHLQTSIPSTFTGVDVAPIIGANTFHTNGYTGGGTIARNIEAGHIWNGHETLGHVATFSNAVGVPGAPFGSPAYDRHATWVGMMIGGRPSVAGPDPQLQDGVARDTTLQSGAIATSWAGSAYALSFSATISSLAFPYATGGFGTADTINSSWGATGASGSAEAAGVDVRTMITDSLANGNRFTTFVASAGNSGASGVNTVGAPGSGYNGITVGALQNIGNVYASVAGFSSHGPQDYRNAVGPSVLLARVGVDIAAPGTNLTSAYYGGQRGGNDASLAGSAASGGPTFYSGGLGGTSFAAPITAGAVTLMHEAAADLGLSVNAEDTRVIKANLLNAAAKIPGWTNAQIPHPNANGGVRTTQALDYFSGAGALDMNRTYTQFLLGETDLSGMAGGSTPETIGWDYAAVSLGGSTDVVITTPLVGGSEFRTTLTWFRDRSYFSAGSQSDNAYANLNLQVWDSTFTTLYSESISTYNPVEHLAFNLPVTGTYGLRVHYPANLFGAITSEEFGLAWYGVGVVPEPNSLVLMLLGAAAFCGSRRRLSSR